MQSRRQQSHERILDAAARALCRDGFAGVGVAAVMQEAGLTHGGFYAHFDSREALLVAAIEHAGKHSVERLQGRMRGAKGNVSPLRALIDGYLSETHVNQRAEGCPVAALAGEMGRQEACLRDASAQRMRDVATLISQALPAGSPAGAAFVITSTLVGALQMARGLDGAERTAVLRACRTALIAQYDREADTP